MSDIIFTNDVKLHAESLTLGIDVNNVIASGLTEYTCTENCWIEVPLEGGSNGLKIDNYQVGSWNYFNWTPQYVSKGTKVKLTNSGSQRIKAFGVK